MKNMKIFILVIIISLISIYIMVTGEETSQTDKMIIAASIMPQKEFIEAVGGDRVKVIIMVPPGADPHTYEPQPSQLKELSKATIYFEVGSGIEFETTWMGKLKELNPKMKIINCSKGITFIPATQGSTRGQYDPHVWTSPKNAIIIVENICKTLTQEDPSHKDYYIKNKETYTTKIKNINVQMNKTFKEKANKKIIVYHPAWGYLCKDYGLEQIAIEKDGKEPSPQTLAKIIQEAKKDKIKIIIISPQDNRQNAEAIAHEIGAKIVTIDPLSENYFENMKKILETLKGS